MENEINKEKVEKNNKRQMNTDRDLKSGEKVVFKPTCHLELSGFQGCHQ